MTFPLARDAVQSAFVGACRGELAALKPGNVHVHAAGHGMETAQFEAAAEAAAPWISDPALRVGARIENAVAASLAAAGCNTNLGILLLAAPLAAAAQGPSHPAALRLRVEHILAALDRDDARHAYRAILQANPAGLGTSEQEDVAAAPTVTLLEAMAFAAGRDRIARAYVTGYDEIFAFGLPELHRARSLGASNDDAVTTLHMAFLAEHPDSHIARKHGDAAAAGVVAGARAREHLWRPVAGARSHAGLMDFDRELKTSGLNPGTTADLVVATLFAEAIIAAARAAESR